MSRRPRLDGIARGLPAAVFAATAVLASPMGHVPETEPPRRSGIEEHAGVELVLVPVSVRAADGSPVLGLARSDFVLLDEGAPQEIVSFDPGAIPVSLVCALDRSGSMETRMPMVRGAAVRLVQHLPGPFRVALLTFGDAIERVCDFTFDRRHLYYEINRQEAREGGTAMYAAIERAIALLRRRPGRRVVAVFTDGEETAVPRREEREIVDALIAEARALDVSIFFLVYGGVGRESEVRRIADQTGGEMLRPAGERNLTQAFGRIARDLESQYTLGFHPRASGAPGTYRRLEVLVRRPEVLVASRPGYARPR